MDAALFVGAGDDGRRSACRCRIGRRGHGAPGRAAAPAQTPIIDPEPDLRPAFLPLVARRHDPRLPEPLGTVYQGYLAELRSLGRARCAPATHVLLDKPEGTLGAAAIAVLRAGRPRLNLDLYVGRYVEVAGPASLSPADCRILTDWSVDVESVTVRERPPG